MVEELTFEEILRGGRSEIGELVFEEGLLGGESQIEGLEISEELFGRESELLLRDILLDEGRGIYKCEIGGRQNGNGMLF